MYNINTEHCRSDGWGMDKGIHSDQQYEFYVFLPG